MHVLELRSNPEAIFAVVCTRMAQLQTSVVIFSILPDEKAVQGYSAQIRDLIGSMQSFEGDLEKVPVQA